MSCIHYKFSSKLDYDTVAFTGLHISLHDLKRCIMGREKLKAANCDLQIINAQTKEEYTNDNALIPKNSSVIVRRIPVGGVKATSKTCVMAPISHKTLGSAFRSQTEPVSGTSKAIGGTGKKSKGKQKRHKNVGSLEDGHWANVLNSTLDIYLLLLIGDPSASIPLAQLIKTASLAEANASEEDKIKAMMTQSCHEYDPINYMKKPLGPPPLSHTCFHCGGLGHYKKNCPENRDKNFESVPRIKKSTGIPMSFMMEVKDPSTKGAMLTNSGKYAIPTINAEAYSRGKKEKPPFLPEEPSSSSSDDSIPEELLCPICKDIMTDAVLIPCCGNSYCDECIRTALLESEEHTCPTCHQTDVSPDALIANKFLRQSVNNFRNETGYSMQVQQQQQQLPPPPPPPPLMRPTITRNLQPLQWPTIYRQQDPLMIPLASLASHSAATLSSLAPGLSSVAAGLPVNPSSVVVADLPPPVSLTLCAEKADGPFRSSHQGCPRSEHTQRTQAPTLPASAPVFVPVPPPPLCPPPLQALPLPPGLPPPPCPQFPPGQPPSAGYTGLAPGYPSAPANMSPGWLQAAVPTAHSNTIPRMQAPPLSREEFSRDQPRLKEEEKRKSKLDEFTNDFAKELMEYKKIQKERRCSSSRSKSPSRASFYSRSLYTYSKSRSGSSSSRSYSRSFIHFRSRSYSPSPPYPRKGKGKSCNYGSRSRSHGYHCSRSRSRSPPYRRHHARSRSPVFRGQSPTKQTIPQGVGGTEHFNRSRDVPPYDMKAYHGRSVDFRDPFEKERYREWERNYREWYENFYKGYAVGTQPPPPVNRKSLSPDRFGPPAKKSKSADAKPEKRKRKVGEMVDEEREATSIKASKAETTESKTSSKGKTEPDGEKGERTPEKDKSAILNNPTKKIKLHQETGQKIVSGENVPPAKEPVEKPEPSSSKVKQEEAKGKVRRKVTTADGSSSALVDYTSISSAGGSPVRKTEEKADTKRTVIKTVEEYNNITAPDEDVIMMIQVPQSKWDMDDSEDEEEGIKSTPVPTNIGKPVSVIKTASAKPPNPVKHNEKAMEPLEETQKTTKEASYESSQHDTNSSKSSMSNEKGKTKDQDCSLPDKDTSEKRKSSVQHEKDDLECATEQGNGKTISQSSKDSRSSEKHDTGCGSTAKDFTPKQDKKSDHDCNRDHSSSKPGDGKSELARQKDSPPRNKESTSVQKSKLRDEQPEPYKKGAGDAKRSSYSSLRAQKQSDHKAAHDSKRTLEEHKPLDKNAGNEKEKHVPGIKSNKEKEPGGNKPPLRQESPDVKNEKESAIGQKIKIVVKPKPQVSSSSGLSSDLTQETDEAVLVPDYNESDNESNVSAKDEEAAGKNPKEPQAKTVDQVKGDLAAPAASEQPAASRSESQSSPSVSHNHSQSPSESQTRRHSSSARSGESEDSKKKKKEKKQHKKDKKHKKHKKHIGKEMELENSQKHKHKKKKLKRRDKEKDDQNVNSVTK